jgi:hypothetical protein
VGKRHRFTLNFPSLFSEIDNVGRILFFVILGLVLWLVLRGVLSGRGKRKDQAPRAKSPEGETMVTCARCGVNLPRSSTREEAGVLVCEDNPRCRGPS